MRLELWVHCLVVCERPACVAGEGHPSLQPRPHKALAPPISSSSLPPSLSCLSPLFQNPCPHLRLRLLPLPSPHMPVGSAALALPALSLLSPVLFPLQLPADRVRQVHPVLRAPGPPSTSNQIPLFLGDFSFQAFLDGCSVT